MLSNRFCTTETEPSSCNRDHMAHEPEIFTIWSLTGKKPTKLQLPGRESDLRGRRILNRADGGGPSRGKAGMQDGV